MRRNFTSPTKQSFFALIALFWANSQIAFSQQCPLAANAAVCTGVIEEDFSAETSATTFTSTQFTRVTFGANAFLRAPTPTDRTVSLITTNTYRQTNATNTIFTGFLLRSNNNFVSSFTVDILSSIGTELATCTRTTLINGANNYYCIRINDPDLVEGVDFRIRFTFSAIGGNNRDVDFDDFSIGGLEQAPPLPVDFISFDAKKAENGVLLTWNVGTEINVERYDIERSTDGNTFEKIGAITATQNSTYNFTDQQPLSGTSYYRVRNVDFDGQYAYTTVLRYSNGQADKLFNAFPTLTRDKVTLKHPSVTGQSLITITNLEGRTIRSLTPARGSMSTLVDFSILPSGTYLLRFQGENGQSEIFRIVKQ
ncbi:MAG TPA: T9SS type A sorting domain-containing protein [Flavisolibacter sp.]|nr:T9SS type A sorting domain-containing protein [Flavisolibacter sp.]